MIVERGWILLYGGWGSEMNAPLAGLNTQLSEVKKSRRAITTELEELKEKVATAAAAPTAVAAPAAPKEESGPAQPSTPAGPAGRATLRMLRVGMASGDAILWLADSRAAF